MGVAGNAGIIHQHINPAISGNHSVYPRLYSGAVGYIHLEKADASADFGGAADCSGTADFGGAADFGSRLLPQFFVNIADDHARPFGGKFRGGGPANAGSPACNQAHFVL